MWPLGQSAQRYYFQRFAGLREGVEAEAAMKRTPSSRLIA